MNIRMDQAHLTRAQRQAFANAVLALKRRPSRLNPSTASRYDDYVSIHLQSMTAMTDTRPGWAHQGPAFLPWHRHLLHEFELDLQTLDPNIALPYWDWTANRDPAASGSPWTDEFMGGDGDSNDNYHVTTGPFAGKNGNWKLTIFDDLDPTHPELHDPDLRRNFMAPDKLPTKDEVNACLKETPYYIAPWMAFKNWAEQSEPTQPSFCNRLEGWYGRGSIHNRVHVWVAGAALGSMAWMTSPNDPIFFLHHANIDRLWAKWQAQHPDEGYHPTGTGDEIGPFGHNLNDPMQPWGGSATPASVLDHHALGYAYDTEEITIGELTERLSRRFVRLRRPRFGLSKEDQTRG